MSSSAPVPSVSDLTPSTLDLDLLRTFVQVASSGTFAGAGSQVHRSQSGVSQQMQRLEAIAGAPLFRKDGRNKLLTDNGHQLLRYAREMLALNDDALATLRMQTDAGWLRIGSPHDVADTILPQVLSRLARLMPGLSFETRIGRSPALMTALQAGELDLAISTREAPSLEGFVLRRTPIVWMCATHFSIAPHQPIPLILGDEFSIFRRFALDALERHQIPWRQIYRSSSPLGVKAALRAGLGVTVRSMEMVSPEVRVLDEQDGFPTLPEIDYSLWMRPQSINPHVRQAFALLKESQRFLVQAKSRD
ncbi:LysR substrate-binding domain-containing protein [Ottowia thiooxydans]|uniref:LysR substrate-binding domain-containing protein n=1 Tax=Ottowia thiooxydans TaxID=219182 RepID=UPI0003F8AEE9|nr:LysR substrate-binding domain-containing protein [Ottowia thiooxydans]